MRGGGCAAVSFASSLQLHQVERLKPRLQIMMFMGNFEDDINLVTPVST